jgi:hypothetical protein
LPASAGFFTPHIQSSFTLQAQHAPPPPKCTGAGMMNRTDVMVAVVNMAELGGAFPADEAISHIAAMIDRLDVLSDTYQRDAALLLGIGATIWTLAKAGSAL